jgi:predicted RNA-binding protein with PIN domain
MRVVIVDGYNIIYAWPELRAVLESGGAEEARRRLTAMLADFAAVRHVEVTVVFDGPRVALPQAPEKLDGVTVRFSGPAGSADHVIERLAYQAARGGRGADVVVATSDRLQRDMVRAMGVTTMDARTLEVEVRGAAAETSGHAADTRRQGSFRRRLEHQISPQTLARLEALRRGQPDPGAPAPKRGGDVQPESPPGGASES